MKPRYPQPLEAGASAHPTNQLQPFPTQLQRFATRNKAGYETLISEGGWLISHIFPPILGDVTGDITTKIVPLQDGTLRSL